MFHKTYYDTTKKGENTFFSLPGIATGRVKKWISTLSSAFQIKFAKIHSTSNITRLDSGEHAMNIVSTYNLLKYSKHFHRHIE